MSAAGDAIPRRFLLDPDFWAPRLRRLEDEPRNLVQMPRADLARPGFEVTELRGAIDGESVSRWQVTAKIGFTLDG